VNILGNLFGGWLNRYGIPLRVLFFIALVVAAGFGVITYMERFIFEFQLVAACLFSFVGGVAPATLFATAATLTDSPAQNGLLVGLLFQGAGLGQVIGPLLVGALVDTAGNWLLTPLYFVLAGVLAITVVALLPRSASSR